MLNNDLRVFEDSFSSASSPSFFFPSPTHREALSAILKALDDGAGLIIFSGSAGTGKTTTLKQVIRSLDLNTRPVLAQDRGQLENITNFICEDLSLNQQSNALGIEDSIGLGYFLENIKTVKTDELLAFVNRNLALQPASASEQLVVIGNFLAAEHQENRNVVLFVDNGDNLKLGSLDGILELTVDAGELKRSLQIVIAGSPFLARRLSKRYGNAVALHCELDNLTSPYVGPFIKQFMKVSGFKMKDAFSRPAVSKIARISKGNPSRINAICRASLLNANLSGNSRITAEIVETHASNMRKLQGTRDEADKKSEIGDKDDAPSKLSKATHKRGKKQSTVNLSSTNNEFDLPFDPLERFDPASLDAHADTTEEENTPESEGELLSAAGKVKIRIKRKIAKQVEVIDARKTLTTKFVTTNRADRIIQPIRPYLPAIFASTLVLGLIFYAYRSPLREGQESLPNQSSEQITTRNELASAGDKQELEPVNERQIANRSNPVFEPPAKIPARDNGRASASNSERRIAVQNESLAAKPVTNVLRVTVYDSPITLRDILDASDLALVKSRGLAERKIRINNKLPNEVSPQYFKYN